MKEPLCFTKQFKSIAGVMVLENQHYQNENFQHSNTLFPGVFNNDLCNIFPQVKMTTMENIVFEKCKFSSPYSFPCGITMRNVTFALRGTSALHFLSEAVFDTLKIIGKNKLWKKTWH